MLVVVSDVCVQGFISLARKCCVSVDELKELKEVINVVLNAVTS